jgi:choline-glycine betaine transporter
MLSRSKNRRAAGVLIFILGPMKFVVGFAAEGFGKFLSHYPQEALFGVPEQDPWAKKWTMMHFSVWFA